MIGVVMLIFILKDALLISAIKYLMPYKPEYILT